MFEVRTIAVVIKKIVSSKLYFDSIMILLYRCFPVKVDVLTSVLICDMYLISRTQFMTIEQRYNTVAIISCLVVFLLKVVHKLSRFRKLLYYKLIKSCMDVLADFISTFFNQSRLCMCVAKVRCMKLNGCRLLQNIILLFFNFLCINQFIFCQTVTYRHYLRFNVVSG